MFVGLECCVRRVVSAGISEHPTLGFFLFISRVKGNVFPPCSIWFSLVSTIVTALVFCRLNHLTNHNKFHETTRKITNKQQPI